MASRCDGSLLPHLTLFFAQLVIAASSLVMQVTLQSGVNKLLIAFYSFAIATLILSGVASIFGRRDAASAGRFFSASVLGRLLFLGFMAFMMAVLSMIGLANTSATFVAAMHPLSPVFTALCAVLFGVETLKWANRDGKVKVLGILLCVAGAFVMAMYRGACLAGSSCTPSATPIAAVTNSNAPPVSAFLGLPAFQLGILCVILGNLINGSLAVFSAKLLVDCPAPPTILAVIFGTTTVFSGIALLVTIGFDSTQWLVPGDVALVILLNGCFSLTLFPFALLWGVMKLGPTVVSCYTPVNPIMTAVLSLVFLRTSVYLGNAIGAALLIFGLLSVSWAEEERMRLKGIENCEDLEKALLPDDDESHQQPQLKHHP